MTEKRTAAVSLPKSVRVRGCEIKRLALGGYLLAVEALQELPGELMSACFPSMDAGQILTAMKDIDAAALSGMVGNAMLAAPKHILRLTAQLTGIDERKLLEDPNIGLDGLVELLAAWVEVNNLGDFLPAVRKLIAKFRTAVGAGSRQQHTGSNA